MPESISIAGDLQAAALAYVVSVLGESFTIVNQVAGVYSLITTEATPIDTGQTVKGIYDYKAYPPLGGATDVRMIEKAVIISTVKANGQPLAFTPGVGDLVVANGLNDSIRDVRELRGPQGVTTFYRLILENA